jgi:hypothetical protein
MSDVLPYRLRVFACIHPDTYKYYFDRGSVWPTWEALEREFGPISRNDAFGTQEILTRALIIRSTKLGNPVTVIRRRTCSPADVAKFHDVVGFAEDDELGSSG